MRTFFLPLSIFLFTLTLLTSSCGNDDDMSNGQGSNGPNLELALSSDNPGFAVLSDEQGTILWDTLYERITIQKSIEVQATGEINLTVGEEWLPGRLTLETHLNIEDNFDARNDIRPHGNDCVKSGLEYDTSPTGLNQITITNMPPATLVQSNFDFFSDLIFYDASQSELTISVSAQRIDSDSRENLNYLVYQVDGTNDILGIEIDEASLSNDLLLDFNDFVLFEKHVVDMGVDMFYRANIIGQSADKTFLLGSFRSSDPDVFFPPNQANEIAIYTPVGYDATDHYVSIYSFDGVNRRELHQWMSEMPNQVSLSEFGVLNFDSENSHIALELDQSIDGVRIHNDYARQTLSDLGVDWYLQAFNRSNVSYEMPMLDSDITSRFLGLEKLNSQPDETTIHVFNTGEVDLIPNDDYYTYFDLTDCLEGEIQMLQSPF